MPIQVRVNGDLTQATDLAYTSSDPGGFDTCTFRLERKSIPTPGSDVMVTEGNQVLWHGLVEEPGRRTEQGREAGSVNAMGYKAELDRNPISVIYIDRGLDSWQGPSTARRIAINGGASYAAGDVQVAPDTATPSLVLMQDSSWTATSKPAIEGSYDAGPGNYIGQFRGTWTRGGNVNNADTNYSWIATLGDSEATVSDTSGELRAAGPGTVAVSASASTRRWVFLQFRYDSGPAGTVNMKYELFWSNVRVIGNHGLPVRGTTAATEGFYTSDIVADALRRSKARFVPVIAQALNYIVPHCVYRTPVTAGSTIITEQATLAAWHWGVWEPGPFDRTPRFLYQPPPPTATASVRYYDCAEAELVERYSEMHDVLIATYADPVGTAGRATVTRPNPRLPSGKDNTLTVDLGTSTSDAATALGRTLLLLDQLNSTKAGYVTLPGTTLEGRPSHWLRPGRDRLGLIGAPSGASYVADKFGSPSAVRIKKIDVRVQNGTPIVRAEFDAGANLVDALNARLAVAATASGLS